jgi:hypothetical protein
MKLYFIIDERRHKRLSPVTLLPALNTEQSVFLSGTIIKMVSIWMLVHHHKTSRFGN